MLGSRIRLYRSRMKYFFFFFFFFFFLYIVTLLFNSRLQRRFSNIFKSIYIFYPYTCPPSFHFLRYIHSKKFFSLKFGWKSEGWWSRKYLILLCDSLSFSTLIDENSYILYCDVYIFPIGWEKDILHIICEREKIEKFQMSQQGDGERLLR